MVISLYEKNKLETKRHTEKMNKTARSLTLLEQKLCISALPKSKIKNKTILIRIDANVPIKGGNIIDDTRLKQSLPTIKHLLKKGAKRITLISHLGRPAGIDESLSLGIIAQRLAVLLKQKILFVKSHNFSDLQSAPKEEQKLKIVLLENLRFNDAEKQNSLSFARKLAEFGTIYVNDAFGTAHRKHASNNAITKLLPSYTGLLIQKEIKELGSVVSNPQRPFLVLVGFAKISDKIQILTKLLQNADLVLIGGAVAQTFLLAKGIEVGRSLVEKEQVPLAKELLKKYENKIVLPIDVVCAKTLFAKNNNTLSTLQIPPNEAVFDIGPKTTQLFLSHLQKAKNIFWNGPMGVFEIPPYDTQTNYLISELAKSNSRVIIGGGDTANAINKSGLAQKIAHISTGGGSSLAFIKNPILPAFAAILKSHNK